MSVLKVNVDQRKLRATVAITATGNPDLAVSNNPLVLGVRYIYIVMDVATDAIGFNRFINEMQVVSEEVALGLQKPFGEALQTGDVITERIVDKGLTESVPTSEAKHFDVSKQLSDTVASSDDFLGTADADDNQVMAFSKTMAEEHQLALDNADLATRKALADPVGTSEVHGFDMAKARVDTATVADVKAIGFTKEVNDSVDAGDEFNAQAITDDGEIMVFGKSIRETFIQVDEISVQAEKGILDDLFAVDEIIAIEKGKEFAETAVTSERTVFDMSNAWADGFTSVDQATVSFKPVFKDYPSIGDGPYFKPTYAIDYFAEEYALEGFPMIVLNKGINDTVHTTDDFLGIANADDDEVMSFGKTLLEVKLTSDTTKVTYSKALADLVSKSDSIAFSTSKSLADTFTKSDLTVKGIGKVFTDSKTTSDSVSRSSGKGLTDVANTAEYNSFAISKKLSDTVVTTDDFLGNANADDDETMLFQKMVSDSFTKSDLTIKTAGKGLADTASTSESGSIIWTDYWDIGYTDTTSGMYVGNSRTF